MSRWRTIALGALLLCAAPRTGVQAPADSGCLQLADNIVRRSLVYLGTPYEWAANGPSAFDCSGFVHYVYQMFGIKVARNSKALSQQGVGVSVLEARRGDLIFFVSGTPPERDITHVGIVISDYADGNLRFVHANRSVGKVSVDEFRNPKFRRTYGGVRRVLPCK